MNDELYEIAIMVVSFSVGLGAGILISTDSGGAADCMKANDTYTCHQEWVPGPEVTP